MHVLYPKGFCADQSRNIHSQYCCDTTKRNHHQAQSHIPQSAQLTETPWHTYDHLPRQATPHLDQASNYWYLMLTEAYVGYFRQHWGELIFHKF